MKRYASVGTFDKSSLQGCPAVPQPVEQGSKQAHFWLAWPAHDRPASFQACLCLFYYGIGLACLPVTYFGLPGLPV